MDGDGLQLDGAHDFSRLALLGGRLPLNFTNTLHGRLPEPHGDLLTHYGDLLSWSVHAGGLTIADAVRLMQAAQARPEEARHIYRHALQVREGLHDLFAAYVYGRRPEPEMLDLFNAELSSALAHLEVEPDASGDSYGWRWGGDPLALDRMLWPIVREAADLLTSSEVQRVRECGGCGWMFLDSSKNRSRRWCSMDICGNQAKARRHYQRQREAK
jgi:predicted RNA-binding Zn ribbon-like protein